MFTIKKGDQMKEFERDLKITLLKIDLLVLKMQIVEKLIDVKVKGGSHE